MLRYLGLPLPFELVMRGSPLSNVRILEGLPSYCYDMHTRIGRSVLQRPIRGSPGAEDLRRFFAIHRLSDRSAAAGMALFYSEGGLLRDELAFVEVLNLEQRMMAQRFGLKITEWNDLRARINEALEAGVIDRLRSEQLEQRASQMHLPFDSDGIGSGGDSS